MTLTHAFHLKILLTTLSLTLFLSLTLLWRIAIDTEKALISHTHRMQDMLYYVGVDGQKGKYNMSYTPSKEYQPPTPSLY